LIFGGYALFVQFFEEMLSIWFSIHSGLGFSDWLPINFILIHQFEVVDFLTKKYSLVM